MMFSSKFLVKKCQKWQEYVVKISKKVVFWCCVTSSMIYTPIPHAQKPIKLLHCCIIFLFSYVNLKFVDKKYWSLQELRQAVFAKKVDGILVDSYVADSRRDLFGDLSIKQVIDLRSSYGVVMGGDSSKIRKCVKKYWHENAAMRTRYIEENTNPVEVINKC